MRSELLLLVVVASLFGYFLLGYVKKSEGEGDVSVFGQKASLKEDATFHHKDSIGQLILDVSGTSDDKRMGIWKRSPLHDQFMTLFPNFTAMRDFVQDRIVGEALQQLLLKQIGTVEDDFFSGKITQREAKEKLDQL